MTHESCKRFHDFAIDSRRLKRFGTALKTVAMLAVASSAALACSAPALANHSLTELQSTGPIGGTGLAAANFRGISADGTRVFLQTSEPLVSLDTDSAIDVYERANGATTLVSLGPAGGNGANSSTFLAASQDGSKVFFR